VPRTPEGFAELLERDAHMFAGAYSVYPIPHFRVERAVHNRAKFAEVADMVHSFWMGKVPEELKARAIIAAVCPDHVAHAEHAYRYMFAGLPRAQIH